MNQDFFDIAKRIAEDMKNGKVQMNVTAQPTEEATSSASIKDKGITPDEITAKLHPFIKETGKLNQDVLKDFQEIVKKEQLKGDDALRFSQLASSFVKFVEAGFYDIMERVGTRHSIELLEYMMNNQSIIEPMVRAIEPYRNPQNKMEDLESVRRYVLAISEALMGIQIMLSFFDDLAKQMEKRGN